MRVLNASTRGSKILNHILQWLFFVHLIGYELGDIIYIMNLEKNINSNSQEKIITNESVQEVIPVEVISEEDKQAKVEIKAQREKEDSEQIEKIRNEILNEDKQEKNIDSDSFLINLQPGEVINLKTTRGDKTGEVRIDNVGPYYSNKEDTKPVTIINGFIKTPSGYNEPVRIIPDGNGTYNVISTKDGTVFRNSAEISK